MIDVSVPGAHVEGEIYTLDDGILLLEDGMLHVSVAGYSIDVSWWPEHDPHGEYVITVYRDLWENQLREVSTGDPYEASEIVKSLAGWLAGPVVNFPASTTVTEDLYLVRA